MGLLGSITLTRIVLPLLLLGAACVHATDNTIEEILPTRPPLRRSARISVDTDNIQDLKRTRSLSRLHTDTSPRSVTRPEHCYAVGAKACFVELCPAWCTALSNPRIENCRDAGHESFEKRCKAQCFDFCHTKSTAQSVLTRLVKARLDKCENGSGYDEFLFTDDWNDLMEERFGERNMAPSEVHAKPLCSRVLNDNVDDYIYWKNVDRFATGNMMAAYSRASQPIRTFLMKRSNSVDWGTMSKNVFLTSKKGVEKMEKLPEEEGTDAMRFGSDMATSGSDSPSLSRNDSGLEDTIAYKHD